MEKNALRVVELVEMRKKIFERLSDEVWGFAEIRFKEFRSSDAQQSILEEQKFKITRPIAGMKTAFMAEWGEGGPLIGILGEFDALPGLSQESDVDYQQSIEGAEYGHGCGHHLLGTAAVEAAVAIKDYLEESGIPGRIRYYATPAEEGASGKTLMLREGCFMDLDICISWHPDNVNTCGGATLSSIRTFFRFHGKSAHAAVSPEMGRSALDAVELMDVGCNYLREHVIAEARIHYAITNSGGNAPNVVQREAEVCYNIRAPKNEQMLDIYARIKNVAEGAALMTGTSFDEHPVSYYANYLDNELLNHMVDKNMRQIMDMTYTPEELAYAEKFRAVSPEHNVKKMQDEARIFGGKMGTDNVNSPVALHMYPVAMPKAASTDLGNVSWNIPTAMFTCVCFAAGTPLHTWQAVAQGKSSIAHKGMENAAKIMALTGVQLFEQPALIKQARADFENALGNDTYECILPEEIKPDSF